MRHAALFVSVLALTAAACERGPNPPDRPAEPVGGPPPGVNPTAPTAPGAGPATFVGLWAAEDAWCANEGAPTEQRPLRITTERFEGYENSCSIDSVTQSGDGYVAELTCVGEGMTARERIHLRALANSLRITWPDRDGAVSDFVRCEEPEEGPE